MTTAPRELRKEIDIGIPSPKKHTNKIIIAVILVLVGAAAVAGYLFYAFAGFILMDFSTGMIFDFVSTGRKIGIIYGRLLIRGAPDEKTAFTYLIQAPFSGVRTAPGKMHRYTVRIDAPTRRTEWMTDGKTFFKAEGIPVEPKKIMMGFGLFTLKARRPSKRQHLSS